MKVKVAIQRTVEVEIDNPVIEEQDTFWRTNDHPVPAYAHPHLEETINEAVKAVEEVVGIPFGYGEEESENIHGVYAMDGEPIVEW